MKTYLFFLSIFIILPSLSYAQLKGEIYDLHTNEPISDVNISLSYSSKGTTTNQKGEFSLILEDYPARILCQHIGYEMYSVHIPQEPDSIVKIFLLANSTLIEGVEILEKRIPQKITENEKYAIRDFLMWGNEMLLLEYYGDFKDSHFSRWDANGKLIHRLRLKNIKGVHEISRACNDKIYLLGQNRVHLMSFTNAESRIQESLAIDFFKYYIKPCELSLDNSVYYQVKRDNDLRSRFKKFNTETKELEIIADIYDEQLIRNFYGDLKKIQYGQEVSYNSTASVNVASNSAVRDAQEQSDFYLQVWYKPKYKHHLFYSKRKLLLFNHFENELYNLTNPENTSKLALSYTNNRNWLKRIVQDEISSDLYTFEQDGSSINVQKIDVHTGQVKTVLSIMSKASILDNCQIHNDQFYYLKEHSYSNSNDVLMKIALDRTPD